MSGGDLKADLTSAIGSATKGWKQAKRQRERVSRQRLQAMRYRPPRLTLRDAAFGVMEDAYNAASSSGRYYAHARQIYYQARPLILAMTGETQLDSQYFTQTLVKDYLLEYRPDWRVVWDARGHLVEPHTGKVVGLGGREVEAYRADWGVQLASEVPAVPRRIKTRGPQHRYANALFIEKEGFSEILAHAGIGERFDMGILSTKGIPNDAACDLIATLDRDGVRVFVVHDFDLAGFKILKTLRDGTRLSRGSSVIDLGLRLDDIAGLPREPVSYSQHKDPRGYLRACGVTADERAVLVQSGSWGGWEGERVEINALTSEQLVAWLSAKLEAHGVRKVVPSPDVLAASYRRALVQQRLEALIAEAHEQLEAEVETLELDGLPARVKARLKRRPAESWDDAVWHIAGRNREVAD